MFDSMRKLSKAILKPNETSRKESCCLKEKKITSKDEVYLSLLRIINLPQAHSFLINTDWNATTLSVIYKFEGFVYILSS